MIFKAIFKYALLLLLFVPFSCLGQNDTLVLNNGKVNVVEITEVTPNGGIKYICKTIKSTAEKGEYITFNKDGIWYAIEPSTGQFQVYSESPYEIHTNFFNRPTSYQTQSKWRIQFDITAPLIDLDIKNYSDLNEWYEAPEALFFNTNRSLALDLGYLIHDKFVLNATFKKGFGENLTYNITSDDWYDEYIQYGSQRLIDADIPRSQNFNEEVKVDGYNSWRNTSGHNKHLDWQIGVSPKFYPFGQTKNAFYIAQHFAFGLIDYKVMDYYLDFDTTMSNYNDNTYINFNLVEERTEQFNAKAFYLRYETLIGLDFNLTKNFSLNIEAGASSIAKNRSNTNDRVFVRRPGQEYEETTFSETFQPQNILPYPIGRAHLIFKF